MPLLVGVMTIILKEKILDTLKKISSIFDNQ